MKLESKGRRVVDEVPYGVYVWQIEVDGQKMNFGEGENLMVVYCRGDNHEECKKLITDAAKVYGAPREGKPVFLSGVRPISDEEYESQLDRAKQGLVPDPLDMGAIKDEMRALQNGGR